MEKPIIFNINDAELNEVELKYGIVSRFDSYEMQIEELFFIRNPRFKFDKNYKEDLSKFLKDYPKKDYGKWVYFTWSKTLVCYLDEGLHQEIRTARNKNLITKEEQEKFYNFKVGVAGLSVGSHGAMTLALMGGVKYIKLADPDSISASNLNRMMFDFTKVGVNKAEAVAQYIYQLNPYAEIEIYKEGVNNDNIVGFLNGLDLIVEELDDIEFKVKIREKARELKIPVIMATDNGDNVIIDIERFDIEKDLQVFHGNLEGFKVDEVKKSTKKMYEAMARIIDISLVPSRMLNSVLEVGKTIYSWPQLSSAAVLSGSVIAYVVRKISLKEDIKSGKLEINLDSILDPDFYKDKDAREKELKNFMEKIN